MTGDPPTVAEPGTGAAALMLLAVLPADTWLTEDNIAVAADAHRVPIGEPAAAMRVLRRRGFVRGPFAADEDDTPMWQLTPSGVDAANAPRQP